MTQDKGNNKENQPQPGEKQEALRGLCGCLIVDACGCYEDACSLSASDAFEEDGSPCRCVNFR